MDNTKNILTPFDAGFSFPKLETTDDRISLRQLFVKRVDYIAASFSPNLVAYSNLHANGKLTIHTMKTDPASPLITPLIAQKFTNASKKNGTFDDLYLLAEQYLNEGPYPLSIFVFASPNAFRIDNESTNPNTEVCRHPF